MMSSLTKLTEGKVIRADEREVLVRVRERDKTVDRIVERWQMPDAVKEGDKVLLTSHILNGGAGVK